MTMQEFINALDNLGYQQPNRVAIAYSIKRIAEINLEKERLQQELTNYMVSNVLVKPTVSIEELLSLIGNYFRTLLSE